MFFIYGNETTSLIICWQITKYNYSIFNFLLTLYQKNMSMYLSLLNLKKKPINKQINKIYTVLDFPEIKHRVKKIE